MGVKSKKNKILELFFNEGTKHWHFKTICKEADISDDRANFWLKKLVKDDIIKHVTPERKMPYFIANFESPEYQNIKKIYAIELLYESGLLNHLKSLKKIKAAVLFGSFSKADWYTTSDIDIFIVGEKDDLKEEKYFRKLGREIQVHAFKNKEDIKETIKSGLIQNVINGYFIKGKVQDLVEVIT